VDVIEEHAAMMRVRAGVGPTEKLDPRAFAAKLAIPIIDPTGVEKLSPAQREIVGNLDARQWSGGAVTTADGTHVIVLHPRQTGERINATIMEEIAHILLGHEPSAIHSEGGLTLRTYDKESEQEAYWTGAAALLPAVVVAKALWRNVSAETLAVDYDVSVELVEFRIRILGLWSEYVTHVDPMRKAS
jgi:Zn-dependent peptidase ImmA (M78 family)